MRTFLTGLWLLVLVLVDYTGLPWPVLALLVFAGIALVVKRPMPMVLTRRYACVCCGEEITPENCTRMCPVCYRGEEEFLDNVELFL